ncbi:MAG TPA: hypothetical protein VJG32_14310 [Anaerolineae bacterium]|nr:hypothetical protein [Anaerolineae bacterium]
MPAQTLDGLRQRAIELLPSVIGDARVESIAFQGGIGRGQVDALSDVDLLLCCASPEDERRAPQGEQRVDGGHWSIFTLCFDQVQPKRWTDKQRYLYAYETSIVTDPNGRLARLCADARLSPEEQVDRVVFAVKKLGNRGCVYRGRYGATWRGVLWSDRPDLWIQRGDAYSAHMRLHQVHELLIDLLFAINGRPAPSTKWKYHVVQVLPWQPAHLRQRLRSLAEIRSVAGADFTRRYELAVGLLTDCIDEALGRELIPEDISRYYFARFSRHSDNTEA